jgi:ParB/RepB/Spo0J family partition protein
MALRLYRPGWNCIGLPENRLIFLLNKRSIMRELKRISVAETERDNDQPRTKFDEQELLALGQNMLAHSQQVPVIVYCPEIPAGDKNAKKYRLLDGERRWRAAQLVNIVELDAIVLEQRPTKTALHILQMSLEFHRKELSAMERSHVLHRIRTENNWQINELADKLNMRQPLVSKLLAYQKLDAAVQAMLHSGSIDMEKAFTISQEGDPAKQKELATAAAGLSREQLRQKAKGDDATAVKTSIARFALASGLCVTVQGRQVTLSSAIEAMLEAAKELRKGQGQGLDISTAEKVMRDKARRCLGHKPQPAKA